MSLPRRRLSRLTTDPTIYTPSSDSRLLGFLPYRTGIAPAFHRDTIIVGPRPLVPQTPSQATAMQQHQQQLAQQSAIGMPQTTGTPISMQQQMKKLPSALNVPQLLLLHRVESLDPTLRRDELTQYTRHSTSTSTRLEQDARNARPMARGFTIVGYLM